MLKNTMKSMLSRGLCASLCAALVALGMFSGNSASAAPAAADLMKMNADQLVAWAKRTPPDQVAAVAANLTPTQIRQLAARLPKEKLDAIRAKCPPALASRFLNVLDAPAAPSKASAVKSTAGVPKGAPVRLVINLKTGEAKTLSADAVLAAEKALAAATAAGEKPPFFPNSKYIPQTMELAYIPTNKTTFLMGSNMSEKNRLCDEKIHEVQITRPFWMGRFEVTQEQWHLIMGKADTNTVTVRPPAGTMEIPKLTRGAGYPMMNVTHDEAMEFCRQLTLFYRRTGKGFQLPDNMEFTLPTEAQWEYACRCGGMTPYFSGDVLLARDANFNLLQIKREIIETKKQDQNNDFGGPEGGQQQKAPETTVRTVTDNYTPRLNPVGSCNPNTFGLCDMHGNVWEWCKGGYYAYPDAKLIDPQGARGSTRFVVRGGSWYSLMRDCRCARRNDIDGATRQNNIGFRVVITQK